MKLGTKVDRPKGMMGAYPSAVKEETEPEIVHKTVSLPLKLFDGIKVKKGERVKICIEGEITGIHDDEYSSDFTMKAEEGEVMEGGDEAEEGDEPGTILGGESKE